MERPLLVHQSALTSFPLEMLFLLGKKKRISQLQRPQSCVDGASGTQSQSLSHPASRLSHGKPALPAQLCSRYLLLETLRPQKHGATVCPRFSSLINHVVMQYFSLGPSSSLSLWCFLHLEHHDNVREMPRAQTCKAGITIIIDNGHAKLHCCLFL